MNEIQFQLELAAFQEKIALSKLEAKKAETRTSELEFELARFQMEWLRLAAKQAQDQQTVGVTPPLVPNDAP